MEFIQDLMLTLRNTDNFRYDHSIGVMETAENLAKHYNMDINKAKITALLHDYGKIISRKEMRQKVKEYNLNLDPMLVNTSDLVHGPIGAEMVKEKFNIYDEEILNAIRYHTVANRNMTKFDMVIYIADVIEPNRREFEGMSEIRKLAYIDIEKAMLVSLNYSLKYILKRNQPIYVESVILRNKLLTNISKGEHNVNC